MSTIKEKSKEKTKFVKNVIKNQSSAID